MKRLLAILVLVFLALPLEAAKPSGWYCFSRVFTKSGDIIAIGTVKSLCERTQLDCLHQYTSTAEGQSKAWKDSPPICGAVRSGWAFTFYNPKIGITYYAVTSKAECLDASTNLSEGEVRYPLAA